MSARPLVRYDAARLALAEALRVDEVKDILNEMAAMEEYARQAKDADLIEWATDIRLRARRKLGELMAAQKAAGLMDVGGRPKTGSVADPVYHKSITLAEAGIDKHLADRARKAAAMPEKEFEIKLADAKRKMVASIDGSGGSCRANFTGENNWFTPGQYLDLARAVLGEIDLDPASHAVAQERVRAKRFFTIENDGLKQPWRGRVWLNPPYSQPIIEHFIDKLIHEVKAGRVCEAIMLTHNHSDTAWFQKSARDVASICFTRGRVRFLSLDGDCKAGTPQQGQAFHYFGNAPQTFENIFHEIGFIAKVVRR